MALAMQGNDLAPWPPAEGCPSWCSCSEGHKATDHPDDRSHFSLERVVPLSLEEPVRAVGGAWMPEWLDISLRQHQTEEPQITVEFGGRCGFFHLTIDEANELARALDAALVTALGKP